MESTREKLETLVATVLSLPEAEQEIVVDALNEITSPPYQLFGAEVRVLSPALARAANGRFAEDTAVRAILDTPWQKPGS